MKFAQRYCVDCGEPTIGRSVRCEECKRKRIREQVNGYHRARDAREREALKESTAITLRGIGSRRKKS